MLSVAELESTARIERTLRWRRALPSGPGRLMIEGGGVDPVFVAGRVRERGADGRPGTLPARRSREATKGSPAPSTD